MRAGPMELLEEESIMTTTREQLTANAQHTIGDLWWTDLMSTDTAASGTFYGSLFGWKGTPQLDDTGSPIYTMFTLDGIDVAGMGSMPAETRAAGMPPVWNSYVLVEDVDATTARVEALGGTIVLPAMDVMSAGRMAVITDPTGAAISLWQANEHVGAGAVSQPGTYTWSELITDDVAAASSFYTQLFGWIANTEDMGGQSYTTFMNGESMACGMIEKSAQMSKAPNMWGVYFEVADCDASVAIATDNGAELMFGPIDIQIGRFALLRDPQGAVFYVIAMTQP